MSSDRKTCCRPASPWRAAWGFVLSLAVLAIGARAVQLAVVPAGSTAAARPAADESSESAVADDPFQAELARLYAHCPTAATIDLEEAIRSPERVDALLPPFRETAAHEPDDGVPRVRYPHPVRVAQAPARVDNAAPQAGGDWLVDPDEWFTPEEQRRRTGEPAATAPTGTTPATEPATTDEPHWQLQTPAAPVGPRPSTGEPDEPPTDDDELPLPAVEPVEPLPVREELPDAAPTVEQPAAEQVDEAIGPALEFGLDALDDDLSLPTDAPEETLQEMPPAALPFDAPPLPTSEPAAPAVVPTLPPPALPPATIETPITPVPSELTAPPPTTDLFPPPRDVPPSTSPAQSPAPAPAEKPNIAQDGIDPHLALFTKNAYPSARECATCHEEIYEQWSVSAHAYAAVSPMFQKFEQKLNDLSQGTVGYFCMRCHAPVATALGASRAEPLWNLPEVAREGVTCIACHRVQYAYGKSNGERHITPGPIFAPVFGGVGGDGVAETIHRRDHFKVNTSPHDTNPGQDIHLEGIYFDPLTKSEFCAPCHQVAVHPGIKLEVVWEQYRASPACKKGIQCQDCHMGRVPGLPLGYDVGAVANMTGRTVNENRRKSNHIFHGPNYPIAHPGVFPFHLKAHRWTMPEWLQFDWRAGWGTDEFEDRVAAGEIHVHFPAVWAEADDRYDARDIIDDNLKKLLHKRENREQVMENGAHVEGPFFAAAPKRGQDIRFHYLITNTNEGHNLLTASLGAQPQLWANVVLIGPDGCRLWETGYTDSYGDLANIHSVDVRHGRVPFDWQLFNLQTMFLITGVKGTDREFFVPVNLDFDQLPFIRPGVQPISVINHPPFIRMESQSLAPLGSRKIPYRIPGHLIRQPGMYRLSFRMRSRAEPPYFMRFCDATDDMLRSMNEWMIDVHPKSIEFFVP